MVEAVSAEEIGKLPDVSIGELIARLPGVAAQRVGGRAADHLRSRFLARFHHGPSEWPPAGELRLQPRRRIRSVSVRAARLGGGLQDARRRASPAWAWPARSTCGPSGRSNMASARSRSTCAASMIEGGGRNGGFSKYGWRGSASYIDQNENGTLGWMIGYAHLERAEPRRPHQELVLRAIMRRTGDSGTSCPARKSVRRTRAIFATASWALSEWKPSDTVHSVLDLYYSRFKQHTTTRGAEWFSDVCVDRQRYLSATSQTETIDGTPFDVADHVNNVVPILRWDDNKRTDHLFSAGLNNDFRLAEHTHLLADLSYSSNKRDETDIEIFGGYGVQARPDDSGPLDSYDRVIPANGDFLQLPISASIMPTPNHVSLGDRAAWGGYGSEGHLKSPHIKETLASGDLTLRQDFEARHRQLLQQRRSRRGLHAPSQGQDGRRARPVPEEQSSAGADRPAISDGSDLAGLRRRHECARRRGRQTW